MIERIKAWAWTMALLTAGCIDGVLDGAVERSLGLPEVKEGLATVLLCLVHPRGAEIMVAVMILRRRKRFV